VRPLDWFLVVVVLALVIADIVVVNALINR
jgi:hypothetical protein